jgi:hypothetical protein
MEEFIEREGGDFNAFYQECRVKQDDGTPHEKVSLLYTLFMKKYEKKKGRNRIWFYFIDVFLFKNIN